MKIVIADKISSRGIKLLSDGGWQVSLPGPAELAGELATADALVVRSATRVTDELLSKAPRLRVVGRAGVGVDNVDIDAATHRGVVVMNTPGGNATSVAEHALGLMLSMARSIPQLNASMHAGRWEKSGAGGAAELRGKTLGLVGLGRVGAEVTRRAKSSRDEGGGLRPISEPRARQQNWEWPCCRCLTYSRKPTTFRCTRHYPRPRID